jgi:hypothetical protein
VDGRDEPGHDGQRFRTAFGATASETGHLHPLNKRPMDVYYPDNISADLEPAARNQAEEGGTRAAGFVAFRAAERLQAKACPGLDPGRKPVRVKKTRQISPFRFYRNGKGSTGMIGHALKFMCVPIPQAAEALLALSFRLDLANHRR